MSKYIIKNCEVIFRNGVFYFCQSSKNLGKNVYCQDCTDCVMKQIVELCKGSIRENEHDIYRAGRMSLAVNILGELDIQEVE